MLFEQRALWLPKDLASPGGYQDAYRADGERGVAAIADGVSASLFAGSWAKLLTEAIVAGPPDVRDPTSLFPWLAQRRQAWLEPIDVSTLAWHQKPKFQDGASSTLLWVEIAAPAEGEDTGWSIRGFAVGDCCLFHVREGRALRAFPIEHSRLFDLDPKVLGSIDKKLDHVIQFNTWEDTLQSGDVLVLCTDAYAAWALSELENGRAPEWDSLWTVTEEAWKEQIVALRQQQKIRYDDTTVLVLRLADLPGKRLPPAAEMAIDTVAEETKKAVTEVLDVVDKVKNRIQESSAWKWLRGEKSED